MPTTTSVRSDLHHEVRGSGPPVLFISGASGDAGHFARTAERLAGEFTTVTYDRRGCSRSAVNAEAEVMSIAAQADDVAALIEGLGLAPEIAFGTSGGGDILLELIGVGPMSCAAQSFMSRRWSPWRTSRPGGGRVGADRGACSTGSASSVEAFIRLHTNDATFESLDPELRERVLGNGSHFLGREFGVFGGHVPDAERIGASGVALRLLRSHQGVPPLIQATERFAEQIGVAVETISGHHAPYLQRPEAFAEELRAFLRELV